MNLQNLFLLFKVHAASIFNGIGCTFWGERSMLFFFSFHDLTQEAEGGGNGGIICGTCDSISQEKLKSSPREMPVNCKGR